MNNNKPLVTVIVPTIGRPQYIVSAVQSVINQDYEPIEILISDNYSKMNTEDILKEVMNSSIRIISQPKRIDFSEHMNKCIDNSNGYYVMVLSDDDLLSVNYISSMVKLFEEEKDLKVALGIQKILKKTDFEISKNINKYQESLFINGRDFILKQFKGIQNLNIYTFVSLFAKKIDITEAGGFRHYPRGMGSDDFLFYRLALNGIVGISNSIMGYRVYSESTGLSSNYNDLSEAYKLYGKDLISEIWKISNFKFYNKLELLFLIKLTLIIGLYNKKIRDFKISDNRYNKLKFIIFYLLNGR